MESGCPNQNIAEQMLAESAEKNPGPWVEHSRYVALAAKNIAECCSNLDADQAYVLGLLHDIGRREGSKGMDHTVDGYRYCMAKGFPTCARICITHSFPVGNILEAQGAWGSEKSRRLAESVLIQAPYDDYDRLIQLCDALGMATGFCLIEKRLVDVAIRHGINQYTLDKWKAYNNLKTYFDSCINRSIYSVLPGVAENTFA